jgi:hypothetical protein
MIDSKTFQNKRTWLCFSVLQTVESSAYATLRYITLMLDEAYTKFIIGLRRMHKGKWKIIAYNTRKVSVLASLTSIEYRKSQQQ